MKVKKFIGSTMIEVMEKVRQDLGSDAVILNTKEIKDGGFLGLFRRKRIEVIAVKDPEPIQFRGQAKPIQKVRSYPNNTIDHKKNTPKAILSEDIVLKEIQQIKSLLKREQDLGRKYPAPYDSIYSYLLEKEVSQEVTIDLINQTYEHFKREKISPSEKQIIEKISQIIEKKMVQTSIDTRMQDHRRIIHFVGPTGVGKTTTIAKIAAQKMLKDHKKIAFITFDTYRIAAIDQLKTYANILQVPIEVAYSMEDYESSLDKFSAYDYIFVDTAGRNYREQKYIDELSINKEKTTIYLVLALTAKGKDMIDIYRRFESFQINELIFTKLDETAQHGAILDFIWNYPINISYITNGQNVPDDLIQPTPKEITSILLGDYDYE